MTKSTITRELLEEWVAQFEEDGGCDATDRQLEALIRQSLEAMDSEPAAPVAEVVSIYGDHEAFGEREIRPLVGIQQMPYGTKLYRHAQQPVVESEPVAEVLSNRPGNDTSTIDRALPVGTQLYRHAQPAPVVPEEATPDSIEILASARRRDHAVFQWDEDQRNAAADSWNACRAAMLQTGTLTNEDTRQVDELTMWVKRLVRSLKKASPDSKLHSEAMDYLTTKGLISVGDALR